jgi:hypothetical protein
MDVDRRKNYSNRRADSSNSRDAYNSRNARNVGNTSIRSNITAIGTAAIAETLPPAGTSRMSTAVKRAAVAGTPAVAQIMKTAVTRGTPTAGGYKEMSSILAGAGGGESCGSCQ